MWAAIPVRRPRSATLTAVVLGVVGLARALFYEPFIDPACRITCFPRDVTLRGDLVLADRLVLIGAALAASAGAATVVIVAMQAVDAGRPLQPRPIGAICVATALVAGSIVTLLSRPVAMPERLPDSVHALLLLEGAAVVGLLVVVVVERVRLSRGVRRMVDVVTRGQQSAHDQLMMALDDPTATITIWTDDARHVTGDGSLGPVGPGRRRTEIAVRDRQVAVIDHSDSIGPGDLVRRLGPQFAIAVQNDLLGRQLQQQLEELGSSRARVIAAADSERERLERDLHDGAQQRVLALSFELRRGRRLAERVGDVVAAERWSAATALTLTLLQRLRHVANGIYPAVLDGNGLGAALESLATSVPPFRDIEVDVAQQVAPELGRAAYAIVRDAAPARPGRTTVSARDGELRIRFDGARRPEPTVIDRIHAAGGNYRGDGDRWEANLPCG
jgi:signal transduction histidine kinase